MFLQSLLEFYRSHKGGLNGAALGLITAVMILLLGFWRVFFILLLMGIGYYIGKRLSDDKDYIKNLLDRILPPGTYR